MVKMPPLWAAPDHTPHPASAHSPWSPNLLGHQGNPEICQNTKKSPRIMASQGDNIMAPVAPKSWNYPGHSPGQEGQLALGCPGGPGVQGYQELLAHPWGHHDPVEDAASIRTLRPQKGVEPHILGSGSGVRGCRRLQHSLLSQERPNLPSLPKEDKGASDMAPI